MPSTARVSSSQTSAAVRGRPLAGGERVEGVHRRLVALPSRPEGAGSRGLAQEGHDVEVVGSRAQGGDEVGRADGEPGDRVLLRRGPRPRGRRRRRCAGRRLGPSRWPTGGPCPGGRRGRARSSPGRSGPGPPGRPPSPTRRAGGGHLDRVDVLGHRGHRGVMREVCPRRAAAATRIPPRRAGYQHRAGPRCGAPRCGASTGDGPVRASHTRWSADQVRMLHLRAARPDPAAHEAIQPPMCFTS